MTLICAWCLKVLQQGSEVISHGLCADCRKLYFPEAEPQL